MEAEKLKLLQDGNRLRKELNLAVRWRVLTSKGGIARIVAYQDARDYQKALDYVCGPNDWENEPMNLNGKMYMQVRIKIDDNWVSKSDVGTETSIESVKGEASDAFKRACVMWGLFRDLYDYDYIVLNFDTRNSWPLTKENEPLKTPEAISLYCNGISKPMGTLMTLYNQIGKGPVTGSEKLLNAFSILKEYIKENF